MCCLANKAEEYFDIYNIQSREEKVKYASMHMEGYAYNWYLWCKRDCLPSTTCTSYRRALPYALTYISVLHGDAFRCFSCPGDSETPCETFRVLPLLAKLGETRIEIYRWATKLGETWGDFLASRPKLQNLVETCGRPASKLRNFPETPNFFFLFKKIKINH